MKNIYTSVLLVMIASIDSSVFASSSLTRSSRLLAPNVARAMGNNGMYAMQPQSVPAASAGQNRSFIAFKSPEWQKHPSAQEMKNLQVESVHDALDAMRFRDNLEAQGASDTTKAMIENVLIKTDTERLGKLLALSDTLDEELKLNSEFTDTKENSSDRVYPLSRWNHVWFASQEGDKLKGFWSPGDLHNVQLQHDISSRKLDTLPDSVTLRGAQFELDKQAYKEAKKLARDIKNKLDLEAQGRDAEGNLIELD